MKNQWWPMAEDGSFFMPGVHAHYCCTGVFSGNNEIKFHKKKYEYLVAEELDSIYDAPSHT